MYAEREELAREGVDGHDQRGVPIGLRALQQAHGDVIVIRLRPVELQNSEHVFANAELDANLEPALAVAVRGRDLLDAPRRSGAEHHRHADRRARARRRLLRVPVEDLLHADGAYQQRARVLPPEQLDRAVAHRRVDEHARPQPVPVERVRVR
jgi:hypothetical protein